MKRALLVVCVLAVLAFGVVAILASEKEREERIELQALTEDLSGSRAEVDSCVRALEWQKEEFLHFDALVDSLHVRVRAFEDPELGGVPEAVYREYLGVFSEYNDSVDVWQDRADALREVEERCRELALVHNSLGDSLRDRYGDTGDTIP